MLTVSVISSLMLTLLHSQKESVAVDGELSHLLLGFPEGRCFEDTTLCIEWI